MNSNYGSIINVLNSYSYLGEKKLEDGTLLIGMATHIAPLAWLHSIYPPLSEEEIQELEKKLRSKIAEDYVDFLRITNGLKCFNTTFCLDGYRKNYKRTINDNWQPFDIVNYNTVERPLNSKEYMLFIGGYDWDGSLLYIDNITNKVHLCKRDNAISLFEWVDFKTMLKSEIKRLITLFDKEGRQINPDGTTLPINR